MSSVPRLTGFDPSTITALVNEPIVRQHADDATFLWGARDQAVFAPHFRLRDIARWDGRLEAHLDGLRIAGDFGWELCRDALADEDPGAVFAAAVLAFGGGDATRIRTVIEAGVAAPELARGLISGLGWLEFAAIRGRVDELTRSPESEIRRVGIAAHAVHRQDPGAVLDRAVAEADPRLKARAIQAAGELGRSDLLPSIRGSLADPLEETRFPAAWSAALLGERGDSTSVLEELARGGSAFAEPALAMTMRLLAPKRALERFRELKRDPKTARLAAVAAGAIGLPDLVPELIPLMGDPPAARAAGEAFASITGVDLAYSDLDGEPPEKVDEEEIPPADPDEDLAWPSKSAVEAWWKEHGEDFETGTRHVLGKPLSREALEAALTNGTQRQRAAAAIDLALRDPSRPMFEVRARGDWQQRRIRSWSS